MTRRIGRVGEYSRYLKLRQKAKRDFPHTVETMIEHKLDPRRCPVEDFIRLPVNAGGIRVNRWCFKTAEDLERFNQWSRRK